jgi:formylglycine-generating enzyme required for sulfatase activity
VGFFVLELVVDSLMFKYLSMLLLIGLARGQYDFNNDGQLDSLDVLDEVSCIMSNCYDGTQGDINSDGYLDIFDICVTVDCIQFDCWQEEDLFTLHSSIVFKNIPGGTFNMGESESNYEGPPGSYDAYLHAVTLSSFEMSETEVTNIQFVHFLNGAFLSGLLEVHVETNPGPNMGDSLVFGTQIAPSEYVGMIIYNLSGTRVMKDHDNADGDSDPFTGVIEPENPLNIAYIGYDELNTEDQWFYVKNPRNPNHFNWIELTNYHDYTDISHQNDTTLLLNDFYNWEELEDYPNNLPTLLEVGYWPVSFVKWYGAKAFTLFYDIILPSEAQWEYAAKGSEEFIYSTSDGNVYCDGTSANWNYLEENPSRGHVLNVKINESNPYQLYNMGGNVWEWIEDWYDPEFYNNSDNSTDPINTEYSGLKVRRGGSWNYHQTPLKSSARAEDEQFKGNDHFGFRVAR